MAEENVLFTDSPHDSENNKKLIHEVFQKYKDFKNEIVEGFISKKHILWLTEELHLKRLSNEELSSLWNDVNHYFTSMMLDEEKQCWKPGMSFERDTESAWLEVINLEARNRKKQVESEQFTNLRGKHEKGR